MALTFWSDAKQKKNINIEKFEQTLYWEID